MGTLRERLERQATVLEPAPPSLSEDLGYVAREQVRGWARVLADLRRGGIPTAMSFTIPNLPDAAHQSQAGVDKVDLDILAAGVAATGVVSGCAVTAQGTPDMTLAVGSGSAMVDGALVAVAAGNVTITAANATNPRFDLVVVSSSGAKSVVAGTPAAEGTGLTGPVFPAIPASSVVLAAVRVPANDTAIQSNQIVDKRVTMRLPGLQATVMVAASDAAQRAKNGADYVCDGVNDEVELQAAVNSLPTADTTGNVANLKTAGLVQLSGGTFKLKAGVLVRRDRLTFRGFGRGVSILKRDAGWTGTGYMLRFDRDDNAAGTSDLRPCMYVNAHDFAIDGSVAGVQGDMDGLYFKAARSSIKNLEVCCCNGRGIVVRGVLGSERGGAVGDWTTYGTSIVDVKVYENGRGGVLFTTASVDAAIGGADTEIYGNAGPGVDCETVINTIKDTFIWGNRDNALDSPTAPSYPGAGILLRGGSGRCIITSNKIEQNRSGIKAVAGSSYVIQSNVINSNSYSKVIAEDFAPQRWFMGGSTTLAAAISTTGQTTATLTSAALFPTENGGYLTIDSEIVQVTAGAGTVNLTIARAQLGTTAATHALAATVYVGKQIALGQTDDIWIAGTGGAPSDVFIIGNTIAGNIYAADQSRYAIRFDSGDRVEARMNEYTGAWAGAGHYININTGSNHFDFEALPVFKDNGTVTTSLTIDPFTGETQLITLGGNITMNAPSFARVGMRLRCIIKQDATGGRTITWNAAFSIGAWKHKTGPSQSSEIQFTYDGANWVASDDSPSVLIASASLNFGNTAAAAESTQTVTVTGAAVGDIVLAGPGFAITAGILWAAWVSAANTVSITCTNAQASTAWNQGANTWRVLVYKQV